MAPVTRSRKVMNAATPTEVTYKNHHLSDEDLQPLLKNDEELNPKTDMTRGETIPVFTIDLSLPPAQRYVELAERYKLILQGLATLFDEQLAAANLPRKLSHAIANLLLRRMYSKEETEELRGIHKTIDMPMYLLIAYNVLLDVMMGCTSGGVPVRDKRTTNKMLHFRTLDWEMPALKRALVQLEFVECPGRPVIARSITYAGFVGVLTGVRKDLSISLNFRPYHNNDASKVANLKFFAHQIAVLLGFRPSISAHLRSFLYQPRQVKEGWHVSTLADIVNEFPAALSTAAYVILCDGAQTVVLEKDRATAKPLASTSFIAATNHDISYEKKHAETSHKAHAKTSKFGLAMESIVEESMIRKSCLRIAWEKRCRQLRRYHGKHGSDAAQETFLGLEDLKEMMSRYPITNEVTHFVAVMDPADGTFVWVKRVEGVQAEDTD